MTFGRVILGGPTIGFAGLDFLYLKVVIQGLHVDVLQPYFFHKLFGIGLAWALLGRTLLHFISDDIFTVFPSDLPADYGIQLQHHTGHTLCIRNGVAVGITVMLLEFTLHLVVNAPGLVPLFVVDLLNPLLPGISSVNGLGIVVRNVGELTSLGY